MPRKTLPYLEGDEIIDLEDHNPWNTQWNYHETEKEGEVNLLPSATKPNDALSVKTLLERYTSGRPIDEHVRPGLYDYQSTDEVDSKVFDTFKAGLPNLATLDLADKQKLKEQTDEYVRTLREKMQKDKDKKKREAQLPPPTQDQPKQTTTSALSADVKTEPKE